MFGKSRMVVFEALAISLELVILARSSNALLMSVIVLYNPKLRMLRCLILPFSLSDSTR